MASPKQSLDEKPVAEVLYNPIPASLVGLSEEDKLLIERRLVRKVDLVLLPIVGILYIYNYIDRQSLAVAKLQGIMEDLNLSTQQFATAVSILFVGYIPFQLPSNLIISRVSRPGLYICSAVVLWGSVSACTAAVQSYSSLLVVRVLLGVTEAVFFSGVVYFLSAWYTKAELGKRLAALFVAQQLGNAFGGLIAAGVLKLDGVHGIRGWRWLFIVEGVATVGCGAIAAFILPEYPHNARILNQVERDLAVYRLEMEAGASEAHDNTGTWAGFTMALKDPKIYVFIFMQMMAQAAGTVTNYFPSLVQTLGYNKTITLVLTAPPYIFAGFFFMAITYFSDKTGKIYVFIMGCIALSLGMYIIPIATLNTGARYFAMMLMPAAAVTPQILLFKLLNLHCPRPIVKRAAGVALMNSIGNTSNIWASYLYYAPPHYYAVFGTMCAVVVVFAIVITLYGIYVKRENRLLEEGGEVAQRACKHGITQDQLDLNWRYVGF
ncbi:hypothetical protein CspHIS471_0700040 [Cutaneotrichosporon sp. HIS471]|nr:hypothetical protein CspHIS471_0700040 [Cutaneotrichosporon sp. HIS471]